MTHGPTQAIFGLGDDSDSNSAATLLDGTIELDAADVDIVDAGGFTSNTTVEAALQEIYGLMPYVIEQSTDLVIDTTVGDGSALRDTSLLAPVVASTKYIVEATLFLTATANSGWKVGFTAPSGATLAWGILAFPADDNVDRDGEQAVGDSHGVTEALTFDIVKMVGLLTVDATAGNVTVQAAQNADHADDTVVHAESFLRVTRVR